MKKHMLFLTLILTILLSSCSKGEPTLDAYGVPYDPSVVDLVTVTENHKNINEGNIEVIVYDTNEEESMRLQVKFVDGYLYSNENNIERYWKNHGPITELISKDSTDTFAQSYLFQEEKTSKYSSWFFENWSIFDLKTLTTDGDYLVVQSSSSENVVIRIRVNSNQEIDHVQYLDNGVLELEFIYTEINNTTLQLPEFESVSYLDFIRKDLTENGVSIELREDISRLQYNDIRGELNMITYQITWNIDNVEVSSGSSTKRTLGLYSVSVTNSDTMQFDVYKDNNEIVSVLTNYGVYDPMDDIYLFVNRHYLYTKSDLYNNNN